MFAAMLDRAAGHFRVGPADVTVPAGRRYVPGTLVLETTWQTRTGWVVVRDALLIGPWYDDTQRAVEYQRPPDDHEAEHCLLRTIRCVNGHVELAMDCEPALDYGRKEIAWEYKGEGYRQAIGRIDGSEQPLQLSTDLRMGFEGRRAHAETTRVRATNDSSPFRGRIVRRRRTTPRRPIGCGARRSTGESG
jgi:GH15 family glucan-1,4-alpha-glucosidase